MAFEKKTFAPAAIAKARGLYEDTQAPLSEVAASLGIARTTLAARIIEWGWKPRQAVKPAMSAGRQTTGSVRAVKPKSQNRKRQSTKRSSSKPEKATPQTQEPIRTDTEKSFIKTHDDVQQSRSAGPVGLTLRVQRVVERELDAIDQILGAIGAADAVEAERSARTLASLARALKEVMRLAAPDESADADADDDPVPRDLDEFRRELARRIEALAGDTAAETAGDGG